MESIWRSQPFELRGVDSDNGGEFLNHHLYHWLKEHGIQQTRSRPYYKKDQAYVEQKNHTHAHARLLPGYDRFGRPEPLEPLNGLLIEWILFKNTGIPQGKSGLFTGIAWEMLKFPEIRAGFLAAPTTRWGL